MTTNSLGALCRHQGATRTDPEYELVVPSEEFYCPVTKEVLLDPHQTRCCGNTLSARATSQIQREEGGCPICKTAPLMTYPDQNFYRRVCEQQVFCPKRTKGCTWVGELANVVSHKKTCSRNDYPIQEDMSKSSPTL